MASTALALPGARTNPLHPLSRGLVGWWPLSEGSGTVINDLSVNAKPGTLQNMPVTAWVGSPLGGGLAFDGTDDFVDLGASPTLNPGTQAQTISFWLSSTDTTSTSRLIQKRGTGAAASVAGFQIARSPLSTGWRNTIWSDGAGNSVGLDSATELDAFLDGNWHHLGFVFTPISPYLTVYADGINRNAATTITGTIGGITTTRNATFGAAWDDASTQSQFYPGLLSDVRIYNRALSAAEIQQLYTDPYAGLLSPRMGTLAGVIASLAAATGFSSIAPIIRRRRR